MPQLEEQSADFTTAEDKNIVKSDKNEPVERKVFWTQWVASLTLSQITFIAGLSQGWSSPYLAKLSLEKNVDGIPKLTDNELSWLATLINIGKIFGVIFGAVVQELIGRKNLLCFTGLPMLAGWVCVTVTSSVDWLYAARFTNGLSLGILWTVLPHYIAEIADPKIRGSLTIWNITTLTIGLFIGNLIGPYVSLAMYAYICIGFNISYIISVYLLPDSPYRYIMQGYTTKAEKSLKWFRRSNNVERELQELKEYISDSKSLMRGRLKEIMERQYRRSFLLMGSFSVFAYFSAYNVIVNTYTEIIVSSSKISITPNVLVSISAFLSILTSLLATFLVDRFGRRFLLIASSLGMAISLAGFGIQFKLLDLGYDPVSLTWLPCSCLLIYRTFFEAGVGCIPSTLIGELFSPRLKSLASIWHNLIGSVTSSLSAGTYVPLLNVFGESYLFWFYATGTFASVLYYFFFVPETMGKSLQEIQRNPKNI